MKKEVKPFKEVVEAKAEQKESSMMVDEEENSEGKEKSVAVEEDGLGSKHSNSMDLLSLGSDGGINI